MEFRLAYWTNEPGSPAITAWMKTSVVVAEHLYTFEERLKAFHTDRLNRCPIALSLPDTSQVGDRFSPQLRSYNNDQIVFESGQKFTLTGTRAAAPCMAWKA